MTSAISVIDTASSYPRCLLIVACSYRKRKDISLLPALDRYDGPAFRVLRRFLQQHPLASLHICILSAEFGLISHERLIPDYDRRMTPQRSQELKPSVLAELKHILSTGSYQKLFICVGKDYRSALDGHEELVPPEVTVEIATGGLGKKLAQLHDWLHGKPPELRYSSPTAIGQSKKPRIRGIEVKLTPEQVLDVARQGIAEGKQELTNFQAWYVPVENQQVAPKWLVSQLTGLPVRDFTTQEARRLLAQLGIEVRRV